MWRMWSDRGIETVHWLPIGSLLLTRASIGTLETTQGRMQEDSWAESWQVIYS